MSFLSDVQELKATIPLSRWELSLCKGAPVSPLDCVSLYAVVPEAPTRAFRDENTAESGYPDPE